MTDVTLFEREALPQLRALERFAFHLCRDEQNARDLVQDTLLKAYTHFPSYQEGTDCRAWLFRICRNSFLNETRRRSRQEIIMDFQDEGSEKGGEGEFNEIRRARALLEDSSQMDLLSRGLSDDMARALDALPMSYQTAVVLCDLEDHAYDEIAELMHIPVGTVRSRIHRGRKILASQLIHHTTSSGRNR